nr:hypothetical protein [Clostridioides sp.]
MKNIVSKIIEEQIQIDKYKIKKENWKLNNLYGWIYLEDSEINDNLKEIANELDRNDYPIIYYKDIIVYLLKLEYVGFKVDEFKKSYIEKMSKNILSSLEINDNDYEHMQVFSDDKDFIKKYNDLMNPVFDEIKNKKGYQTLDINKYFDKEGLWGNDFVEFCKDNKKVFLESKNFFYLISVKKLVNAIENTNIENIYLFLKALSTIYYFENIKEFYNRDIKNLKEFNNKLDIKKLSNNSTTRKYLFIILKISLLFNFYYF